MDVTRDEFEDLLARHTANSHMMLGLVIALKDADILSDAKMDVIVESTLAAIDQAKDPFYGKVAKYIEEFRTAA